MTAFLGHMEAVAGRGAVRPGTGVLAGGIEPQAVVEPEDAAGVAAVLRACSEAGVPVEPAGAGSWLRAGRPRSGEVPLVVSTRRLAHVVEYEPADLVIGVGAGVSLYRLAEEAGSRGQAFTLDPPSARDATVGAVLALGSAGPLRARHGTPRDMALGVEVATGDGRLLRFGGRVVKNVAGYDLVRLLVGSRGRLGIITAAYLLLRGTPEKDATFVVRAKGAADAAARAQAIRDLNIADALEVLGPGGPHGEWRVVVRLLGSAGFVEAAHARVAPADRDAGDDDIWSRLGRREAEAALLARIEGKPSDLPRLLELAAGFVEEASAGKPESVQKWRIAAHAVDGIVRIWQGAAAGDEPDPARLESAAGALAEEAGAGGAAVSWPILPAGLHDRMEQFPRRSEAVLRLEASIRRAFDPAGILPDDRHG